jgi:hypothetical protein
VAKLVSDKKHQSAVENRTIDVVELAPKRSLNLLKYDMTSAQHPTGESEKKKIEFQHIYF